MKHGPRISSIWLQISWRRRARASAMSLPPSSLAAGGRGLRSARGWRRRVRRWDRFRPCRFDELALIYKSLQAAKTLGALPPQDEVLNDTMHGHPDHVWGDA